MTAMTCERCRETIAVADLTDWGDMDAVAAHCRTCEVCAAVVTDVRDSARRVADLLDSIPPGASAALVARRAEAAAALERQQARRRRALLYPLGGGAALLALLALAVTLRTSPGDERRNVVLHCLAPEQAVTLVTPLLGGEGTVAVRSASPARVVSLTGPAHLLNTAEAVIEQYDNPESRASCEAATPPPNAAAEAAANAAFADMVKAQAELEAAQARRAAEEMRQAAEEARRRVADEERRAAARRP
jgi:hypothetical protein